MSRWGETGMGFKHVKVSPEMVVILVGGLTVLALVWDLRRDMSDLQIKMSNQISDLRVEVAKELSDLRVEVAKELSDLRVEMSALRVDVSNEISSLNERMAYVEGFLRGYHGQPRAERELPQTE